ncbi:hypothetical protein PaecuDRAFT_2270 [Paenibacillus curdlanolyticus YK9]|uniref:ParB/Sulfiredoxin domain-containing protein n=1 Tax=Paenibacillus curdlanolyticus YK9 TaxID=717606 RepID=E0I9D3_9BACL|nr:hypothetical protein [Paenibacillus curdlanolyticus]EFM11017.1 hypothetical protein PaecuDRAFT_2270 [Paenibacillus curdlanolyticus YK9]
MKPKVIKINDLHINEDNPRDESQEDEAAAMKILFKNEKKLFNLMKSIAEYGFEISERIIVVENGAPNKYLILDGNRRITCIKLLNTPELLPPDLDNRNRVINRIKKIKEDFNYKSIPAVDCVIYDIPAEEFLMKRTIQNKHTGENNGAGRLAWDYKAQNRFMNDDYKIYLVEFLDNILKVERSLSTMERIFSDPDMRTRVGVIIDKKLPEIKLINSDSEKKLYYILQLIKNKKVTVSDVYYKEDRENFYNKYFIENENWRSLLSDSEERQPENKPVVDERPEQPENKPVVDERPEQPENKFVVDERPEQPENKFVVEERPDRPENKSVVEERPEQPEDRTIKVELGNPDAEVPTAKQPDEKTDNQEEQATLHANPESQPNPLDNLKQQKPENISFLFQGIIYYGGHPGIKRALYELHRLRVSTYTLSATYLTRTLLECTLQEYLIKNGLFNEWKKPEKDPSITDLLNYCVSNKSMQNINQNYQRTINVSFGKKDHDELNSITHGKYNLPSPDILWDIERRWRILIKHMIENLNSHI